MTLNRGYAYESRIGRQGAGTTLLDHLARTYRRASREEWAARIDRGEVTLDGRDAPADAVLRAGQSLVWHRPPWDEPEVPTSFDVLYEDEDLLAVAKPSGLPTMPGGGFLEHTLLALVRAQAPCASPMHRLGRATSGLVLFARTPGAGSLLQAAWRAHEVDKRYRALAAGVCEADTLEIDTPIGRVPHLLLGTVHAASPSGKPARSVAHVLERRDAETLFAVDIVTGRPHQIRIHLAAAGFPLAGDPLYAAGGLPLEGTRALPGDPGYLLHSERLVFTHPRDGRRMELHAPPPASLRAAGDAPGSG